MNADVWLTEAYFDWLRSEAFSSRVNRTEYEGVMRTLHDIPFYWTIWSDENRAGDAMSFRNSDFLGFQPDLEKLDQVWLGHWAMQAPSVLEVLLSIARRWNAYFEGAIPYYFGHLFRNMGFDRYPGRMLDRTRHDMVRETVDIWLSRQFQPNGEGSPFPINPGNFANDRNSFDMRKIEIWGQMNAYSAEHFQ